MRQLSRLCAVLLLISASAFAATQNEYFRDATPEERAMTSVPGAPGASAAILHTSRKQDDTESYASEYMRIKIFTEEGKKHADIELAYVPREYDVKDLRARTIHPDGTVVMWDGKLFEKLIVKKGRKRVMAKTFTLPDVRPGSIIEYRYVRTWPRQQLLNTRWIPQADIPILKADLWLKPYAEQYTSFFSMFGLPPGKQPVKVGNHFELTLENLPARVDEPFAPPIEHVQPYVDYYYIVGAMDSAQFWAETGKNLADNAEDFIGNKRAQVTRITNEAIAGASTPEEKLKKVYARVQQIRNLSYAMDKTRQEEKREKLRDNRHADDVLVNGYGYMNEIARTFVAMARAAGLSASVARVGRRDEALFAKELPDSSQLAYEIAIVDIDGVARCFDPGTPGAPFGILSWEYTHVPALRLAKKTPGTWVETPNQASNSAMTRRVADLRIENDVVKGTVKVTFEGQQALQQRLAHRHDDEAVTKKEIEDVVKAWLPEGSTTTLKSLTGMNDHDAPVVAELDVEMPNLGSIVGSRALLPMAVFSTSTKNPFAAEQRKNDIIFSYASETRDEVKLKLPEGFVVETTPRSENFDLGGALYTTRWSQEPGAVSYQRNFSIKTVQVPQSSYKVIRSFYSRVGTADQEALVLKKQSATAAK